jgi:hypothetical protein
VPSVVARTGPSSALKRGRGAAIFGDADVGGAFTV